jgi:hypothetical protein
MNIVYIQCVAEAPLPASITLDITTAYNTSPTRGADLAAPHQRKKPVQNTKIPSNSNSLSLRKTDLDCAPKKSCLSLIK